MMEQDSLNNEGLNQNGEQQRQPNFYSLSDDIIGMLTNGIPPEIVYKDLLSQYIPIEDINQGFMEAGYGENDIQQLRRSVYENYDEDNYVQKGQIKPLPQAQRGMSMFPLTASQGFRVRENFTPAKGFYIPEDLGSKGNVGGALGVFMESVGELFGGKDENNDGLADGAFRNMQTKRARHKANKPSYYKYKVKEDFYDPNKGNYVYDATDLYEGKLRSKEQYEKDVMDNSIIDYNPDKKQYEAVLSSRKIDPNLFPQKRSTLGKTNIGLNAPEGAFTRDQLGNYTGLGKLRQTIKDNPYQEKLIREMQGMNKSYSLKPGQSYGVAPDGTVQVYDDGDNPYLRETMMGENIANLPNATGKSPTQQLGYNLPAYNIPRSQNTTSSLQRLKDMIPPNVDFKKDPFGVNFPKPESLIQYQTAGEIPEFLEPKVLTLPEQDPLEGFVKRPYIYEDPEIKRTNRIPGTINYIMDSPEMQAFNKTSGALVAGAGVVNEMFQNKKARDAKRDFRMMGMADKAFGMYNEREGDRGMWDINTGLAQPDNLDVGYFAQEGKEMSQQQMMQQQITQPQMQRPTMSDEKPKIVDLDMETIAKLIAAGADIEIL